MLIFITFLAFNLFAASPSEVIQNTIIAQNRYTGMQENKLKEIEAKLSEVEKKETEETSYLSDKSGYINQLRLKLTSYDGLDPLVACLDNALLTQSQNNINNCYDSTSTNLDKSYTDLLKQDIKIPEFNEDESLKRMEELKKLKSEKEEILGNISFSKNRANNFSYEYKAAKEIEGEKVDIPQDILACDSNSPEINLENEKIYPGSSVPGVFKGLRQDHQDGLGTCYANSAKYLLYGASGGELNSSFLDMALQYKISTRELAKDLSLDAGNACDIINKLNEVGVCEQKDSPFEMGEKNKIVGHLYSSQVGESYNMALEKYKDFLKSRDELDSKNIKIDEFRMSSFDLINLYKVNPNIPEKFPGLSEKGIIETHNILYDYYTASKKYGDDALPVKNEYEELRLKFQPVEMKLIEQGKKPEEIFKAYVDYIQPFLEKHKIKLSEKERKDYYINKITPEFKDKNFKKNINDYLSLLKFMLSKESKTNEEFLNECTDKESSVNNFLQASIKVIKAQTGKDSFKYFEENGQLVSKEDFYQLLIAPKCLNAANRRPSQGITCHTNYHAITDIKSDPNLTQSQKLMEFRKKILQNLVQGIPVGNSHETPMGNHINTIIGMKYNKKSKTCDYIIRESNMGETITVSEETVFNRIFSLAEVRKAK